MSSKIEVRTVPKTKLMSFKNFDEGDVLKIIKIDNIKTGKKNTEE